jgi:hypothetical protein
MDVTTWEYLETSDMPAGRLNELGQQGWELVSVILSHNQEYIFYLKRPAGTNRVSPKFS